MRSLCALSLVGVLLASSPAFAQAPPADAHRSGPDLSRTVTLTGAEVQALIAAVRAEAQAQPVMAKINEAMTPAPADKASKAP